MGCFVSTPKDSGGKRRRPGNIGEVAVFVPGLRIPKAVEFFESLEDDHLCQSLVERLSALRTRIVVLAGQEAPSITRTRRRSATQHGGSTLGDLLQALQDYLPVLLGLAKDGSPLQHKVQFTWINQEDESEEAGMYSAWYEVLSVLQLMATLSLSQANLLLLPRTSSDGYSPKVSEVNILRSNDLNTITYEPNITETRDIGSMTRSQRLCLCLKYEFRLHQVLKIVTVFNFCIGLL